MCYPAVFVQIKRDSIRYFKLGDIWHSANFVPYEVIQTDKRGVKTGTFSRRSLAKRFWASPCTLVPPRSIHFSTSSPNGLSEKLLCNFNEVKLSLTKSKQDEIKEAITEKKVALEKKGVDRIFVRNCARHLWFSNRIMPIVVEDTDRRWVAFQANSNIPDAEYFTKLVAWTENDQNARAFFDFLKARDISNWNVLRDRPKTDYYNELLQMSLDTTDQWIIHMIEENALPVGHVSGSDLLLRYNLWLTKYVSDVRPVRSKNFLKPRLKTYFKRGIQYDTETGKTAYYRFDRPTLIATFVSENKISEPPTFLPDD